MKKTILLVAISVSSFGWHTDGAGQSEALLGLMSDQPSVPFSTFYAACEAAVSSGKTLVLTKVWRVSTSASCAAPIQVYGGEIQPAKEQTVTLPPNTLCPINRQCYDESPGGAIRFTSPPAVLSPVQWGADPAGKSDSSSAFNSTALAAKATPGSNVSSGAKITIPCGKYLLDSTWEVGGFEQIEVAGSSSCTNLVWNGDARGPVLHVLGVTQGNFHDFSLSVPSTHPISASARAAAIQIEDGTSGYSTSTSSRFSEIWVHVDGNAPNGFVFNGGDANNDFHRIEGVRVFGPTESCWLIEGSQAYGEKFRDSFCQSGSVAPVTIPRYGVTTATTGGGRGSFGGTFDWDGGAITSRLWDFNIQGTQDFPVHISHLIDETCGGLLNMPDGVDQLVRISDSRWVRDDNKNCSNTGTDVINVGHGFVLIENSNVTTVSRLDGHKLTFTYGTTAAFLPWLTFRNVQLVNENFTIGQLFPGFGANPYWPIFESTGWIGQDENERGPIEPDVYSAGTIGSSGSTLITGSGTKFTQAMEGGFIQFGGRIHRIVTFHSPTSLTLDSEAASGSGQPFVIGYGGAAHYIPAQVVGNLTVTGLLSAGSAGLSSAGAGALNYVDMGYENGSNNAVACASGCGMAIAPALTRGLTVYVKIGHNLASGVRNTFAYNGGKALPIVTNSGGLLHDYAPGSLLILVYDGTVWFSLGS